MCIFLKGKIETQGSFNELLIKSSLNFSDLIVNLERKDLLRVRDERRMSEISNRSFEKQISKITDSERGSVINILEVASSQLLTEVSFLIKLAWKILRDKE